MSSERLTSWKAIAAVFNRDVRTVQRWEKEEGLPVHRHLHHRRHSVWATREELDTWWRQRGTQLAAGADAPAPEIARQASAGRRRRVFLPAGVAGIALAVLLAMVMATERSAARTSVAAIAAVGSIPGAPNIAVQTVRDLNGDGADDLVVHPEPSEEVRVYFGPRNGPGNPDVRVTAAGNHYLYAAPVGDVDGDGRRDLAFSVMYREPDTYHATGPTYLVRGRADWPADLQLPRDADSTFFVDPGPDIRLLSCSADEGIDLNRDGIADLVLGGADYSPPNRRSAGGAFVLFGRRAWPSMINVMAAADVTVHGSHTGQGLTASCAGGDFNADGLTDLALVSTDATLWFLRGRRGSAFVFAGRNTWPNVLEAERDALVQVSGERPSDWIAPPLLVDVNGDGADDLVAARLSVDRGEPGTVAIVFGNRRDRGQAVQRAADVVIEGNGRFGHAVAAADIDADRQADLLVTAPDRGALHVISSRREWQPRGSADDYSRIIFTHPDAPLGGGHFAVGDFDGDTLLDVVLGFGTHRFGLLRPALPLAIDVRPEAAPNVLVPGGIVAIAVRLPGLPLEQLDVSSLRAAGAAPIRAVPHGDGSLRIFFDVDMLRLPPHITRLAVTGRTLGGVPVSGSDSIVRPAAVITPAR